MRGVDDLSNGGFEDFEEVPDEEIAPAVELPEKLQYMTKDEFAAQMTEFKDSLITGLSKRDAPAPAPTSDPQFFEGWEPDTATDVQRYVAAEVAKVHQMYAPTVASREAESVVASIVPDASVATQRYVAGLVKGMGLSPQQIQQLSANNEGRDFIENMAAGHSARQAKNAPIPRSSDPGGSVDDYQLPASQKSNMEEFVQSMSQFMPRKEAEKTFKERVKQGVN